MKLRTICLALPLVYAIGFAGMSWLERSGAESIDVATVRPSAEYTSVEAAERPIELASNAELDSLVDLHVTTPEEVREVVRLLDAARVSDRAILTDIALRAQDALVCGNAIRALGRLEAFCSDAELLALMNDARMRVRQDAVVASGLDGGVESIPFLERVLQGEDATLRTLAIEALGQIGGDQAERLVLTLLDGPTSKTEQVFARVALERMRS